MAEACRSWMPAASAAAPAEPIDFSQQSSVRLCALPHVEESFSLLLASRTLARTPDLNRTPTYTQHRHVSLSLPRVQTSIFSDASFTFWCQFPTPAPTFCPLSDFLSRFFNRICFRTARLSFRMRMQNRQETAEQVIPSALGKPVDQNAIITSRTLVLSLLLTSSLSLLLILSNVRLGTQPE